METGVITSSKKSLVQQVTAIADVFGEDRGLLKLLLALNDDEIAGVLKFSQAYMDGLFPINVMVDHAPPAKKSGIFP